MDRFIPPRLAALLTIIGALLPLWAAGSLRERSDAVRAHGAPSLEVPRGRSQGAGRYLAAPSPTPVLPVAVGRFLSADGAEDEHWGAARDDPGPQRYGGLCTRCCGRSARLQPTSYEVSSSIRRRLQFPAWRCNYSMALWW